MIMRGRHILQIILQFPLRRVIGTDVEGLTVGFWIGIVTLNLAKARWRGLGWFFV